MSTMTLSTMTLSSPLDRTTSAPVRLRVVRADESVPARRPAAPRAAQVRLTRRGRLTVFLASLVAVLALGIALGAGSMASEEPGTPTPTRTVVVGPGDTLWGIAGELASDGEVRAMVDRIEGLNALDTAMVQSGQRLRVPLTE
jgi:Tfp pilus assembly protein FimV